VSETIALPRKAERPPTRPPPPSASISSVKMSPDTTPSSGANNGGVSDSCFRSIAELFAMRFVCSRERLHKSDSFLRYIRAFDKDRLGLESAYASEAILSCRFVSASHAPAPYHFAKCNTGIVQGFSNIVQTLSSFSREIIFIPVPESPLDVTIDILRMSDASYFTTLMFNTIIKGVDVSVDMVFLLKENARLTGKQNRLRMLWSPFVVVSHQIILRA
jgi:hypothetical protein